MNEVCVCMSQVGVYWWGEGKSVHEWGGCMGMVGACFLNEHLRVHLS